MKNCTLVFGDFVRVLIKRLSVKGHYTIFSPFKVYVQVTLYTCFTGLTDIDCSF